MARLPLLLVLPLCFLLSSGSSSVLRVSPGQVQGSLGPARTSDQLFRAQPHTGEALLRTWTGNTGGFKTIVSVVYSFIAVLSCREVEQVPRGLPDPVLGSCCYWTPGFTLGSGCAKVKAVPVCTCCPCARGHPCGHPVVRPWWRSCCWPEESCFLSPALGQPARGSVLHSSREPPPGLVFPC